jgi:hypothetical protein
VAVSFIGGGNRRTGRKPPTCRKSLTTLSNNVVSSTPRLNGVQTPPEKKIKNQNYQNKMENNIYHSIGSLLSCKIFTILSQIFKDIKSFGNNRI